MAQCNEMIDYLANREMHWTSPMRSRVHYWATVVFAKYAIQIKMVVRERRGGKIIKSKLGAGPCIYQKWVHVQ